MRLLTKEKYFETFKEIARWYTPLHTWEEKSREREKKRWISEASMLEFQIFYFFLQILEEKNQQIIKLLEDELIDENQFLALADQNYTTAQEKMLSDDMYEEAAMIAHLSCFLGLDCFVSRPTENDPVARNLEASEVYKDTLQAVGRGKKKIRELTKNKK